MKYPKIDTTTIDLTPEERRIAEIIVKRDGTLRASKPKAPKGADAETQRLYSEAAYVWRMVAFFVSPNPRHHHMLVTADFSMKTADYGGYKERRRRIKELDVLVNKIVDAVPVTQWNGVRRWSQALRGF